MLLRRRAPPAGTLAAAAACSAALLARRCRAIGGTDVMWERSAPDAAPLAPAARRGPLPAPLGRLPATEAADLARMVTLFATSIAGGLGKLLGALSPDTPPAWPFEAAVGIR